MTTESLIHDPDHGLQQIHLNCFACGRNNPRGLHLHFSRTDDGKAIARFYCSSVFEGYPRQLHGGIIALLLDGAMTHCLFLHGFKGVTADLQVRYRHPIETDRSATIRGWIERSSSKLNLLKSEIIQSGEVKVTASGKFMKYRN